jgi:heme/copper-type cytochrome/quinol oxidase subunit 1
MPSVSPLSSDLRKLFKFLLGSAAFLFIGTVHGVLQVIPPIRTWLDSIGSPYGGPGHMLDPLAHAHINMVGGVVLLCMAVIYYLLTTMSNRPIYSMRLVDHTFWWTAIGVTGFYVTLLVFGILEGHYLLTGDVKMGQKLHAYYGPIIAIVSTVMGMGFWIFFANVAMTIRSIYQSPPHAS